MAGGIGADMCDPERCGARAAGGDRGRSHNRPRQHVEWARIVLVSADRGSPHRVAQSIEISRPTVWRWQQRFAEARVESAVARQDPQARRGADRGGYRGPGGGADLHRTGASADPLDRPRDGEGHGPLLPLSAAHLAGAPATAAPHPYPPTLARSQLCRQTQQHCRSLCRSADTCRGPFARREKPNPSPRPHPTRTAIEPGAARP